MGNYTFLIYIGCIIMIFIIGKIFIIPLKKIAKLVMNSAIGGVLLYVTNIIGSNFNFHIGINWWTMICTGFLGIPGVILIVFTKILLR